MSNIQNHIKVLSALSLASSDERIETLTSVVLRVLFDNSSLKRSELINSIDTEFKFSPYQAELDALIDKLVSDGRLNIKKDFVSISEDEIKRLKELEVSVADGDKVRFQNFKNFITDTLESDISINQIKFLWTIFLKYLYDSFYEYGHDAIKTLHPHIDNGDEGKYQNVFEKALASIKEKDTTLCEIFKNIVERFPDFASENDLEFLNNLAQKLCLLLL